MTLTQNVGSAKYPTKRTVNLAKRESHKKDLTTIITGAVVIALLCFVVSKFGVIDQFARLNDAEKEYSSVHEQNVALKEEIEDYPEIEQEYRTYSRKWMKTDSNIAVSVDRSEVLDMLESKLMSCGTMRSFMVDGNTVLANMSGMNLEEISVMFDDLQRQPIVRKASLTIASTTTSTQELLDFSITITLQPEEEAEQ